MKYLVIILIIFLFLLAGCQKSTPRYPAYPKSVPAYQSSTSTTTISTTTVFDCKSCPSGTICRNNECIKVEYSNTGSGGSSGY